MFEQMTFLEPYLAQPWVRAGLILLGGAMVAAMVRFLFKRVVLGIVGKTRSNLDDRVVAILQKPVFYLVWLVGVGLAVRTLDLPPYWHGLIMSTLKTVAFLMALVAAGRVVRLLLHGGSDSKMYFAWLDSSSLPLFDNILKIAMIGLGIYLVLAAWNVNATPWLASAGIVGIAVGFAAKDSLANLFGGMFILADAPYKIGDYIVLDGTDRGSVTHIGLRSTRILTRGNVEVTIPNGVIANSKIVNESGGPSPKYRVSMLVGVSYDSDIEKVRKVLESVANDVEWVEADPPPVVRFTTFGASSLDFQLLGWIIDPALRGRCLDAMHTMTFHRFKEHNIEIPFPQRVVHMSAGEEPEAS
jgi:MscS family membrane protein